MKAPAPRKNESTLADLFSLTPTKMPSPTKMLSKEECYSRLSTILLTLSMDPTDKRSLEKNPAIQGVLMGVYLMNPTKTEPKDALKEIWRNNYQMCKKYLEGPKIQ